MVEIGEVALYFSVGGFVFALFWGFVVVAWRVKRMIVGFLESKRAARIWKAAASYILPEILARMAKLEAKVSGELALVGPRMAAALPQAPDFDQFQAEVRATLDEMREVKSTLLGNLTMMKNAMRRLEEMEGMSAKAAAAQLGLEGQELDPDLTKKLQWAKIADRLDPNDPSLSMVEAAGVVLAKEALARAQAGGLGDILKGGVAGRGRRSATSSEKPLYY